jgi:hypothetical protein
MAMILIGTEFAVVIPICRNRPMFRQLFSQDKEFIPDVMRYFRQALADLFSENYRVFMAAAH